MFVLCFFDEFGIFFSIYVYCILWHACYWYAFPYRHLERTYTWGWVQIKDLSIVSKVMLIFFISSVSMSSPSYPKVDELAKKKKIIKQNNKKQKKNKKQKSKTKKQKNKKTKNKKQKTNKKQTKKTKNKTKKQKNKKTNKKQKKKRSSTYLLSMSSIYLFQWFGSCSNFSLSSQVKNTYTIFRF